MGKLGGCYTKTLILKIYAKRRGIKNISPQNLGGKMKK